MMMMMMMMMMMKIDRMKIENVSWPKCLMVAKCADDDGCDVLILVVFKKQFLGSNSTNDAAFHWVHQGPAKGEMFEWECRFTGHFGYILQDGYPQNGSKWLNPTQKHFEVKHTHTHISYIHIYIYPHLASGLKTCWISHAYVENGSQQAPVGASPCTSWFGFPGDAGMNRHQLWYMWAMDVWIHQNRLVIFKPSPGTNQPVTMRSGELAIAFPNIIHGM